MREGQLSGVVGYQGQQNPQKEPQLCETEPCEMQIDRMQDGEGDENRPQAFEGNLNNVNGTDGEGCEENGNVNRLEREGRPIERLTYNTLGEPLYLPWSVDVNPHLPNHPLALTLRILPFLYPIHSQRYYYYWCPLIH